MSNDKQRYINKEKGKQGYNQELEVQNIKSSNGIIGLAIGDALGVPAEFKYREELRRKPITNMI